MSTQTLQEKVAALLSGKNHPKGSDLEAELRKALVGEIGVTEQTAVHVPAAPNATAAAAPAPVPSATVTAAPVPLHRPELIPKPAAVEAAQPPVVKAPTHIARVFSPETPRPLAHAGTTEAKFKRPENYKDRMAARLAARKAAEAKK